jgi:hypothetical protein
VRGAVAVRGQLPLNELTECRWCVSGATGGAANCRPKRLRLERLPGYAPDVNPDEGIWAYLKYVELRNVCCTDLI